MKKYKNIKRKIWDKNKKLRVFFIFIFFATVQKIETDFREKQ